MSKRPEITAMLSQAIQKHINPYNDPRIYWAREVTFDYTTNHAVRVDFMRFKPHSNTASGIEKGDFYCYEVKSSVEDFRSKNGHNFIGDFNYYVMPEEVFEKVKNEIPHFVGVFVPDGMHYQGQWYNLKSVKKASRINRERPAAVMVTMMYRSTLRDLLKYEQLGIVEECRKDANVRKKVTDIVDEQLIAGKNNYKEVYACFQEIVDVVQDNY